MRRLEQPMQEAPSFEKRSTFSAATRPAFTHSRRIAKGACYLRVYTLRSLVYPQITWRFEQALTLGFDGNSSRDQILRATLDGVAKRGFHLIHPALYGELLGFTSRCASNF